MVWFLLLTQTPRELFQCKGFKWEASREHG